MESISFIIPVYNGAKYIKRCLKSILAQDYNNLELIVIDDGSTDNSLQIINSTITLYNTKKHKTIIKSQSNMGVAEARNLGIKLANSTYISFVDQDDYISTNFCSVFHSALTEEYDIVIGGFLRRNEKGKTTRKMMPVNTPWSKFCFTYPWARIIRRDFLTDNNIKFLKTGIGEDVYFDLVAYSYTDKIKYVTEYVYVWFDNPTSVSNVNYTKVNSYTDPIVTFDKTIKDLCTDSKISHIYLEYYFIKFIVWYILSNLMQSDKQDMLKLNQNLFSWLEKNFSTYKKNPMIGLFKAKGDLFLNNFAVFIYITMHKTKTDKLFISLFSKHK